MSILFLFKQVKLRLTKTSSGKKALGKTVTTGFKLILNFGFELASNWCWTGFELVLSLFGIGFEMFELVLNWLLMKFAEITKFAGIALFVEIGGQGHTWKVLPSA